ncbi:hypothetical protein KOI35_21220 [Actinoplanes bogorensis]|uniref:histidine kinase n=1 Tax=Paractinoplanes bogorensis TaxID=1610840 RepID=A0ABS5YRQ7_9ACTN|nr:histidine kinase [Actinoplanes bogorensis]MBU2666038.1 hypothetical protein [Actinoplanes bogorensis]
MSRLRLLSAVTRRWSSWVTWWQRRPAVARDGLFGVLLALLAFAAPLAGKGTRLGELPVRPVDALAVVAALAMSLPLALRRRYPAAVLALVAAGFAVQELRGYATFASLGVTIALYSAAAYLERFRRAVAATTVLAYAGLAVALHAAGSSAQVADYVIFCLGLSIAWLAGSWVRDKRIAEAARRRREAAEIRDAERAMIARELHDVVTHHVTAIVVQAGAAQFLTADPTRTTESLSAIGDTGRRALSELRDLLGVLDPHRAAHHAPPDNSTTHRAVDHATTATASHDTVDHATTAAANHGAISHATTANAAARHDAVDHATTANAAARHDAVDHATTATSHDAISHATTATSHDAVDHASTAIAAADRDAVDHASTAIAATDRDATGRVSTTHDAAAPPTAVEGAPQPIAAGSPTVWPSSDISVMSPGEATLGEATPREAGHAPRSRLPGLAEIAELVERSRSAGQPIELIAEGEAPPLGAGREVTAYRVVQEALTNAMKYAPGGPTLVRLGYRPDGVRIDVSSRAVRTVITPVGGSGRGLAGLHERVTVFGGELSAGPGDDGTFAVTATIPSESTR